MTEQWTQDPERLVAAFREGHEQFFAAGRKTWGETADAVEETLRAFADAGEQLAEVTDFEPLSRYLRAHATLTRDVVGACCRFTRELTVP
jgi:hypothetical protein